MKRIVVKVGSSTLTELGELSLERMRNLVAFLAEAHQKHEVILVTSGAVAAGHTVMPSLSNKDTAHKQALAAVGQAVLINRYQKKFADYGITVAQILLTKDDFDSFRHSNNAKNAINTLLDNKILPIINENDSVVIDELLRGDNDQLSAQVAYYFDADLLIILSDIDGYYDKNPKEYPDAVLLKKVHTIDPGELSKAASPNFAFATGGIVTKLKAADFLLQRGKGMLLASGFDLGDARQFLKDGTHQKGTYFMPPEAS